MARHATRWLRSAVGNENVDLYVMAAAAFVFTILGATGLTSTAALLSMTLAVLTGLSLSQIKTRRHVTRLGAAATGNQMSVLGTTFPADLAARRENASSVLHISISMGRTAHTSITAFDRVLSRGGRIRVLVVDPTDDAALAEAVRRRSRPSSVEQLRSVILGSLGALGDLSTHGGSLELRVSRSVPAAGINAIDQDSPDGLMVAQHYEFRARGEAAPIFRLTAADGFWYRHFLDEAERMWADATPWPLPLEESAARSPRPAFSREFGPALLTSVTESPHLFITGAARNTFLTSNYGLLEKALSDGRQIRFLLIDPASSAVEMAAERYYADRSAATLRDRIDHSLRLLSMLSAAGDGDLEVRLTPYPLAAGLLAGSGTLFVEYFTYQAPGEPKFVLTPADGWVFDNFLGEAEALWAGARVVDLRALRQQ